MHFFQNSVDLDVPVQEVYAFHENPHNIRKISPFFLQVVDVQADSVAKKDDVFVLKLRIFGFPLTWRGVWAMAENPTTLVDTASFFPFKIWRHEHRFEPISGGTRMTDLVSYEMPFGLVGRLFGATIFRLQIIAMFAGRHRATKAYFCKKD
jgi:ligand-binding SRPBCC domain-containing protein